MMMAMMTRPAVWQPDVRLMILKALVPRLDRLEPLLSVTSEK